MIILGFPGGSEGKESTCNAGDTGIPGSGRCPGEGTCNQSSILAWRIPRTEAPGGLQSTKRESRSVVSNSLWPHGLYSPGNSPRQNTGVGSLSHPRGNLPNPGIKPRSSALQADSLPVELPELGNTASKNGRGPATVLVGRVNWRSHYGEQCAGYLKN